MIDDDFWIIAKKSQKRLEGFEFCSLLDKLEQLAVVLICSLINPQILTIMFSKVVVLAFSPYVEIQLLFISHQKVSF